MTKKLINHHNIDFNDRCLSTIDHKIKSNDQEMEFNEQNIDSITTTRAQDHKTHNNGGKYEVCDDENHKPH